MENYNIQVLEVGYDPHFPAGVAFDFWNMADQQIRSAFSMTLIRGNGRCILFDCGMDLATDFARQKIAMEGDQNCHTPDEVLSSIGVDPAEVDSVVLSHCHWDHISGLNYFPNAMFYVQRAEAENWKRAMADPKFPPTHKMVVDGDKLNALFRMADEGRVTFLDGDTEGLFPGISVVSAAGHSFAQNILFIDNNGAHFAVIGDVSMRPESFQGTEVFPCFLPNLKFSVGTIEDIMASYSKIMDWVGGNISHIIMTHNGSVGDVWPTEKSSLDLNVTTVG